MEETLCLLFLCDLLGRVMFSELLTIIPGFLVLSIPMNLLKSRDVLGRVYVQRAPNDYSRFPCADHSDEPP